MDLKAAYDAVTSAVADAQQIAQQIEALFAEGKTDEALAMRDDFQAARQKAEEIKSLYDDMTSVMTNDAAKKFVPAGKTKEAQEKSPKALTRAEFNRLDPKAQAEFALSDGVVMDEKKES